MSTAPPPPPDWPGLRQRDAVHESREPPPLPGHRQPDENLPNSVELESAQSSASGMGLVFIAIAMVLALAVLSLVFDQALSRRSNPNQQVTGTFAGNVATVRLLRGNDGHYRATGEINGTRAEMLLDTGATAISLGTGLARRLQLQPRGRVQLQTANGTVEGYVVVLDEVRLGSIVERDIEAVVSPGLDEEVLLGMNFLKPLEWSQRDNQLTLWQHRQ